MATSSLATLAVNLEANTASFERDLGKAAHLAEKEMAAIAKAAAAMGAALGAAAVTGATALAVLVKRAIDAADQLGKLSQRTGIAVETLSELKFAAELSDISVGDLGTGMARFNAELVKAHDAGSKAGRLFAALGVDVRAGPTEALLAFSDAVNRLESTEAKVATLREAFGKSGDRWLPFIANMREASREARELGQTIDADFAKQAEQFNDNLKRLTSQARRLGIAIGAEVTPPLVRWTDRMVEAVKEGRALEQVLRDLLRLAVSVAEKLPMFMLPARVIGMAMDASRGDKGPTVSGKIGGGGLGMGPAAPAPNQDEVLCVLSGGRWEGGKCVRPRDKAGRKVRDDSEWVARQIVEGEEQAAKEAAEAWDIYARQRIAQQRQIAEAHETMWKQVFETIDRQREEEEELERVAAGVGEKLKEQKDIARDLGLSFSSAFEAAVLEGKRLRDVLAGIAQDFARIVLRKSITEPLASAATDWLRDTFGGKRAAGGPVEAGRAYMVGETGPEMFVPASSGAVVPAAGMASGSPIAVTINVGSLDPRGAAQVIAANSDVIVGVVRRAQLAMAREPGF